MTVFAILTDVVRILTFQPPASRHGEGGRPEARPAQDASRPGRPEAAPVAKLRRRLHLHMEWHPNP